MHFIEVRQLPNTARCLRTCHYVAEGKRRGQFTVKLTGGKHGRDGGRLIVMEADLVARCLIGSEAALKLMQAHDDFRDNSAEPVALSGNIRAFAFDAN